MEVVCIHHNDLDGRCAAAVVKLAEKRFHGHEVITRECNYNDDLGEFEFVPEGARVYVVDFNFESAEAWKILIERAGKVIWIDHHESALKMGGPQHALEGIREEGSKAACLLAWEYLHGNPIPRAVALASDYDTWRFQYGDETRRFAAGMKYRGEKPDSHVWPALLSTGPLTDDLLVKIDSDGQVVLGYQGRRNESYVSAFSFPVTFEGHSFLACNKGMANSQLFEGASENYEGFMTFVFNGSQFIVTMYSKDVNVAEIAEKYGGGGHPGAAGFHCEELPFLEDGGIVKATFHKVETVGEPAEDPEVDLGIDEDL